MFEQDVKLARMLVDKIREIKGEEEQIRHDLTQAREELQEVQNIREERDAYLSILSEAADLLDSKELVVENPDTTEQQERVDELEFKLEELAEESEKYNRLIEALREKAPQLFAAVDDSNPSAAPELSDEAQEVMDQSGTTDDEGDDDGQENEPEGMSAEAEAEVPEELTGDEDIPGEEVQDEAPQLVAEAESAEAAEAGDEEVPGEEDVEGGTDSREAEALELHVGSNGHAEATVHNNGNGSGDANELNEEPARGSTADEGISPGTFQEGTVTVVKVAVESPERTLSRFNLDHLKKKEAFTFGRGAAYVVDGDSVMDRLPYYDFNLRGVLENQTRDELARDIDVLSTELHGRFHVVYNSRYTPSIQLGDSVTLDCADGDGSKEASDEHIRNLVGELIARHTCVCVITGDVALADSVRGQNIHILQLHDFFRA